MEQTYGHFLDIESHLVRRPILVKRTNKGFDVVQPVIDKNTDHVIDVRESNHVSRSFPKIQYYKHKYKYNTYHIPKMEPYKPTDDENDIYEYEPELDSHPWFYFTLTILFVAYLVYVPYI